MGSTPTPGTTFVRGKPVEETLTPAHIAGWSSKLTMPTVKVSNTVKGQFTVRRIEITEHGCDYQTHLVAGYLNGKRVRRRFKNREEALGEKNRLEVQAANRAGSIRTTVTRLSQAQVVEAEACIQNLQGRSLADAVTWYLANYRPPVTDMPLSEAGAAFLEDRAQHVRPPTLRDHKRSVRLLCDAFPGRTVSSVTTGDIQRFLRLRQLGCKRFNNVRSDLHAFFAFCRTAPREWTRTNPVSPIPTFKIHRGLPDVLTAKKAAELMSVLEHYTGGSRSAHPPGYLVPYFAMCLFAGIRPGTEHGEISKLGAAPDIAKYVNLDLGVIRIMPDMAKTRSIRQIMIQPNLKAWLLRYPLSKYPLTVRNMIEQISPVRKMFGLTNDVLRHTFISMHVARFKSLGDAALQAGNSEAMVRKHYLNLVSDEEAKAFWDIVPRNQV